MSMQINVVFVSLFSFALASCRLKCLERPGGGAAEERCMGWADGVDLGSRCSAQPQVGQTSFSKIKTSDLHASFLSLNIGYLPGKPCLSGSLL